MAKEKMTQCEKILKYLKDFGSITSLQAIQDLGIMRLASRISELNNAGYNIRSEYVSSKNRYGENVSYKRYYLGEQ